MSGGDVRWYLSSVVSQFENYLAFTSIAMLWCTVTHIQIENRIAGA
jgi:hypothetical protein